MVDPFLPFLAGFAGSFHCIGMCGGFACALGRDARGRGATTLRHLLYNTGRMTTYCFLGGIAGALGQTICRAPGLQGWRLPVPDAPFGLGQRGLALAAGLLMIAMALRFFGIGGVPHKAAGFGGATFAMSVRGLLAAPGAGAPLALGVVNGFLPCPLVYALLAQAASTGHALSATLTMMWFSLGTFPAMLAMGGLGRLLAPAWRRRGVWLAGSFILALGLVTLARGIVPMAGHAGHPLNLT